MRRAIAPGIERIASITFERTFPGREHIKLVSSPTTSARRARRKVPRAFRAVAVGIASPFIKKTARPSCETVETNAFAYAAPSAFPESQRRTFGLKTGGTRRSTSSFQFAGTPEGSAITTSASRPFAAQSFGRYIISPGLDGFFGRSAIRPSIVSHGFAPGRPSMRRFGRRSRTVCRFGSGGPKPPAARKREYW